MGCVVDVLEVRAGYAGAVLALPAVLGGVGFGLEQLQGAVESEGGFPAGHNVTVIRIYDNDIMLKI